LHRERGIKFSPDAPQSLRSALRALGRQGARFDLACEQNEAALEMSDVILATSVQRSLERWLAEAVVLLGGYERSGLQFSSSKKIRGSSRHHAFAWQTLEILSEPLRRLQQQSLLLRGVLCVLLLQFDALLPSIAVSQVPAALPARGPIYFVPSLLQRAHAKGKAEHIVVVVVAPCELSADGWPVVVSAARILALLASWPAIAPQAPSLFARHAHVPAPPVAWPACRLGNDFAETPVENSLKKASQALRRMPREIRTELHRIEGPRVVQAAMGQAPNCADGISINDGIWQFSTQELTEQVSSPCICGLRRIDFPGQIVEAAVIRSGLHHIWHVVSMES